MKKLIIACAITTFANFAFAEPMNELDQVKANPYTQLCLASLKSEQEFARKARELGITKSQRDRLVCNEMEIDKFASTYELSSENTIATVQ